MPQAEILTAAHFYLELTLNGSIEPVDAVFMECKGFKRTQEIVEICEVTYQSWGQANAKYGRSVRTKLPGNVKSGNLVLRRGMSRSTSLWKWFEDVEKGNWANQRRDGSITIYDQAGQAQARFDFAGAWPTSYTISDLSAKSTDFEIEEMEMAIEEFARTM
jgi:phage tail-like protein